MAQNWINKELKIEGMFCTSCEVKIEKVLSKQYGVKDIKASFSRANITFAYDSSQITLQEIINVIEKLDYKVVSGAKNSGLVKSKDQNSDNLTINQIIAVGIIIFAAFYIINNTVGFNFIPEVSKNAGYGLLFIIGLITSIHCIAMCGGINLSQCVSAKLPENATKLDKFKPSLLYNMGRVISYTIIGGIVGGLGSVISFSGTAKGVIAIIAGVFMLIMGVNMLGIFPWLRKFTPHIPKSIGKKIHGGEAKYGPFVVGLLNGLMPCGPLQSMQIYALGTGSVFAGAASMLFFSLGTVPLMFGLGAISSLLSSKFTRRMMKVSAVLVMVLGLVMMNRGLALSGISIAGGTSITASSTASKATVNGSIQNITTTIKSGSYEPIVVQKGVPVKWIIKADARSLNGCNRTMTIPAYNITKTLQPGDNIIEFTPDKEGTIPYSCWMGMIRSSILVVSDISNTGEVSSAQSTVAGAASSGGSCCGVGTSGASPSTPN